MTRVLALLGAIAMIAGAVVVRGIIDDEDASADGTGRDPGGRVVCVPELRAVCPAGGSIEDAAVTADRLAGSGEVDAWLTFEPWPAMVDDARTRGGLDPLFEESEALAASALVAVGPEDAGDCDWACLVGGERRIGGRALDGGLGLLHLGAITAGVVGTSSFATNDLVPTVRSQISAVADAVQVSGAPVRQLLQSRAFFDVALAHEAEARAELDAASPDRKAGLALLYPSPVTYVVAVGAGDPRLLSGVGAALTDAGWEAPRTSGLPSAGVLTALRGLL